MLHWGAEYEPDYSTGERNLAHALVDAGADLVAGSGPHVLRGMERYRGSLICYSLGNLIFDDLRNKETSAGVLVRMRVMMIDGIPRRRTFAIAPLRTDSVSEGPHVPSPADAWTIAAAISSRSPDPWLVDLVHPLRTERLTWFALRGD